MNNTNADCIQKTLYFKVRNGDYYGTNDRRVPVDSEIGNDLLWYINEYGYREKPKLQKDETLHTMKIIVPENWKN